jgi:hypothetical protein
MKVMREFLHRWPVWLAEAAGLPLLAAGVYGWLGMPVKTAVWVGLLAASGAALAALALWLLGLSAASGERLWLQPWTRLHRLLLAVLPTLVLGALLLKYNAGQPAVAVLPLPLLVVWAMRGGKPWGPVWNGRYWLAFAGWLAVGWWIPLLLVDWMPAFATLAGQMASALGRFASAILLATGSWCLLALYTRRLGEAEAQ